MRLDRAYENVQLASGYRLYVHLRDYLWLVHEEKKVRRALAEIEQCIHKADRNFGEVDDALTRKLIDCRNRFVELADGQDDSDVEPPPLDAPTWREFADLPGWKDDVDRWAQSLANFDAISSDSPDVLMATPGHVRSRSNALSLLLSSRLLKLLHPEGGPPSVNRSDLQVLQGEVHEIGNQSDEANLIWISTARDSGYLAFLELEALLGAAEPQEGGRYERSDEEARRLKVTKEVLEHEVGELKNLINAAQPPEALLFVPKRSPDIVEKYEAESREALKDLHQALRSHAKRGVRDMTAAEVPIWLTTVLTVLIALLTAAVFYLAAEAG